MKVGTDCIGVGVGALIFNDQGEILLALRGAKAKNERGKWEIPGGAVEFGEKIREGLKREIKEEIGIEIEVGELLHVCDHILTEEKQHWISPTFICRIINGTPQVKEPEKCDRIDWFTVEEALPLPLSQVTIDDIKELKNREN
jgi:mutator protein MutT